MERNLDIRSIATMRNQLITLSRVILNENQLLWLFMQRRHRVIDKPRLKDNEAFSFSDSQDEIIDSGDRYEK